MGRGNDAWEPGSLLGLLPDGTRAALLAAGKELTYRRRQWMPWHGDLSGAGVLVIRSGRVKVAGRVVRSKRLRAMAIRGPGDIVGELGLLAPNQWFGDTGTATTVIALEPLEKVQGNWLTAPAFHRFISDYPEAKDVVLQGIVAKLCQATNRAIFFDSRRGILARVAACLLEEADSVADDAQQNRTVRLTQELLADLIGANLRLVQTALAALSDPEKAASGRSPEPALEVLRRFGPVKSIRTVASGRIEILQPDVLNALKATAE